MKCYDSSTSQHARIRLEFVKHEQYKHAVESSWMLINYTSMKCISDVANEINSRYFGIEPHTISLFLKDALLPLWESGYILRDGDCVKVRVGSELELDRPSASGATSRFPTESPSVTLSNAGPEHPTSNGAEAEEPATDYMEITASHEHKVKKKKKRKKEVKNIAEDYDKAGKECILISEYEIKDKSRNKKRKVEITAEATCGIVSETKASSREQRQEKPDKSVEPPPDVCGSLSGSSNLHEAQAPVTEATDMTTDQHHSQDDPRVDTSVKYDNMDVSGNNDMGQQLNCLLAIDTDTDKGDDANTKEGPVTEVAHNMEVDSQTKRKRKRIRKRRPRKNQLLSDLSLTDTSHTDSLHNSSIPDSVTNMSENTRSPFNAGAGKGSIDNEKKSYFGCVPGKLEPPQYYRHGYRNLHVYKKNPSKHTTFDSESDDDDNQKTTEKTEQYSFHREVSVESTNVETKHNAQTDSARHSNSFNGINNSVDNHSVVNGNNSQFNCTSAGICETKERSVSGYNVPGGGQLSASPGPSDAGAGVCVGPGVPPTILDRTGLPGGATVFTRKRPQRRQIPELTKDQQLNTVATNKSFIFKVPEQQPPSMCSKQMEFCRDLLKELLSSTHSKYAWPFYKPVDAVALNLPDYHDVIKKPMDLSTIRDKLEQGVYGSSSEFAADMRLIFFNCYRYNQSDPAKVIVDMVRRLEVVFEARFTHLPVQGKETSDSSESRDSQDSDNETQLENQESEGNAVPFSVSPTEMLTANPLQKNYMTLTALQGLPRTGDRIAYKVLEVSANYTPEVSQYKEAEVIGVDEGKNIRLRNIFIGRQPDCGGESGKFDLAMEDEDGTILTNVTTELTEVTVPWQSMLEPRLL